MIRFASCAHDGAPNVGMGSVVLRLKSPGKCLTALRTGMGVNPPIAHREPAGISSQRASGGAMCYSPAVPVMVLSIVSGARPAVAREGVHVTHDEGAASF